MSEAWSEAHDQSLQRAYTTFKAAMEANGPIETSKEFEASLKRLNWPDGPPGLMDLPGVAVQKTFTSLYRASILRMMERRQKLKGAHGSQRPRGVQPAQRKE